VENYFVVVENVEIIGAGGINYFTKEKMLVFRWI